MSAGVLIAGPQGCGKSRHADAFLRHFGCRHLADDGYFRTGDPIPDDTLVLTNEADPRAISFDDALRSCRNCCLSEEPR